MLTGIVADSLQPCLESLVNLLDRHAYKGKLRSMLGHSSR
jgi:hypothetical protein